MILDYAASFARPLAEVLNSPVTLTAHLMVSRFLGQFGLIGLITGFLGFALIRGRAIR